MGMRIIDDDGTVLHEFPQNLGKYLLYRLLTVAKFTGEDQAEIILNEHIAAFGLALSKAMPAPTARPIMPEDANDALCRQVMVRIATVFRERVLSGDVPWARWSLQEKRSFVLGTLFAPFTPSDNFVKEFIEDEDARFEKARRSLAAQ